MDDLPGSQGDRALGASTLPPARTVSTPLPGIDETTFIENAEPATRPLPDQRRSSTSPAGP